MKELEITKIAKNKLTQEELKSIMDYDKNTGVFSYLKQRGKMKKGAVVGDNAKYKRTYINRIKFSLHHLVILYVDGWLPSYEDGNRVDHIDRDTHNNRYNNLRVTNGTGNNKNVTLCSDNTSGLAGIFKTNYGWRVRVQQNYKRVQIYRGKDFFEACCARLSYNNKNEFSKDHGRININEKDSYNKRLDERTKKLMLEESWSEYGQNNLDRIQYQLGV